MGNAYTARHHTIVVLDVEGFGDRRRTNPDQRGVRDGLYHVVRTAFDTAGVPWAKCYHEDRGDAVFILAPATMSKAVFVDAMPPALVAALRVHNDSHPDEQRIRLRMALHAGEVHYDDHGVTSSSLTHTFRLIEAQPLKAALAASPGVLAVITSDWFFDDVVRHTPSAAPATYRPIPVTEKETSTVGWIALPDHPYPPDTQRAGRSTVGHVGARQLVVPRQLPPAVRDFTGRTDHLAALDTLIPPDGANDLSECGAAPTVVITAIDGTAGGIHHHTTPRQAPVPQQLPIPPAGFVGREDELARLTTALDTAAEGRTVVISALAGTGGIGKTWLALHWAQHHIDQFPDGQLAVDLRGFSADDSRQPIDVLADFLAALGVDRDHQPTELEARAALYRTHTTGKRMMILLDNAASASHVEHLLPGGNTCTVLVTSRSRLSALVTRHGARPVHIDVLTDTEARTLLNAALSHAPSSIAAQRAITELISLCGGLPLALGLIATQIRYAPELLDDVVNELRARGLDALDSDDPEASLPTVLSWSLDHLTKQQRSTFALLGIAPGPDISLPAAISLTGLPEPDTHRALTGLVNASLISHTSGGRYSMHDLIRAYATTHAHTLPEPERRTALERVIDFYLRTVCAARDRLAPYQPPIRRLDTAVTGTCSHPLPDRSAALAWLTTEHPHILAAQRAATAHPRIAYWFAESLTFFHQLQGHRHADMAVWQAALNAVEHLPGDRAARISSLRNIGRAHSRLNQHEQAIEYLSEALALAEKDNNLPHQAFTHYDLALAWGRRADGHRALHHAQRALDLCHVLGNPRFKALALTMVGRFAAETGDYQLAREHCQTALADHHHLNNPFGQALTHDSMGLIEHRTGHHEQAIYHYQQSFALNHTNGHTYNTVDALERLGHPHVALGQYNQARLIWQEALTLYQEQGRTTDAQRVQQQLNKLDTATETNNNST
jgi:tetratricopeptide (TPR) repeat protein